MPANPYLSSRGIQPPPRAGATPTAVSHTRPAPADLTRQPRPHLGMRFWAEIDGVEIAGFHECSPITIETETMDYSEGGLNTEIHRLPVRVKYQNITLKRGIDPGQDLYRWYREMADGKLKRRNVSIKLYDPGSDKPVRQWDLMDALPVKWIGPDLKSETGAIAVESLEFTYRRLVSSNRPVVTSGGTSR